MPTCFDCSRTRPTADMRRTKRGGAAGFICKDRFGCKVAVDVQKSIVRADRLTSTEVARLERAHYQLERFRKSLGLAWAAPQLARVRVAHEELALWLANHKTDHKTEGGT